MDTVIDLIAHKLPILNVLKISIDAHNAAIGTLCFQSGRNANKVAYAWYDFVSMNTRGNVALQEVYKA